MMCLLLAGGLYIIVSCDNDELSTDQMSNSNIELRVFGPNPVLRGGELRFIGTNLDKVTGIDIPGAGEITGFTKKEATDVRLTVPQNATEGYVVLHTPQGNITTKTQLTFEEPISITAITSGRIKANAEFEITGDYLNLIAKVVFQEKVEIDADNFVSQTREKIVVHVPREARSGEIMISNGAEIPIEIYSGELTANIVEPAITQLSTTTVKAGATLTITGADLDLVEKVVFGGGKEAIFTHEGEAHTTIKATVPADAQDGAVTLVAWSGVEVPGANTLTLVVPQATGVNPATVKNNAPATITGTNLDLVTAIRFGEVEVEAGDFTINSETEIALTIPETASVDTITLVAASGKSTDFHFGGYVEPTITGINATNITAGDNITISGTDLDLVREVIFTKDEETVSVTLDDAPDASSFIVQAPFTATSGTITLKTSNGTEISSTQSLTIAAALLPVVTNMPKSAKPGSLIAIEGINLGTVNKIEFDYGSATVTAPAFLPNAEGTAIQLYTPNKNGKATIWLTNSVGSNAAPYPVSIGVDPVVDPALLLWDFENNEAANDRWGGLGQESEEDGNHFYEIADQSNWEAVSDKYWWFADNWRTHGASVTPKSDYVVKMDIRLKNDVPCPNTGRSEIRLMLGGQSNVVNILPYLMNDAAKAWEASGGFWTTGGEWITISIPLTEWAGLADPTPTSGSEWGIATWINADDTSQNFVGFGIDNIRYERIN